jgi:N-glycosylase/DNA lyase
LALKLKLDGVPFNLDVTLCCGQVFRWRQLGGWWYGVVGEHVFKVRQVGNEVFYANVDESMVKRYFSLDHDLERIRLRTCRDAYVRQAFERFWGLRLIRQDPWECLISYVSAAWRNIPAINRSLQALAQAHGEKLSYDGQVFYAFPTPERLACVTEKSLRNCGLGYRARYIHEIAQQVSSGAFTLKRLRGMPYAQAWDELTALRGVGPKVADCVLLFAFEKLEAFPVDVWVARVLKAHYARYMPEAVAKLAGGALSPSAYAKIGASARAYFGEYAGYAQQYLYHNERTCMQTRKIHASAFAAGTHPLRSRD